MHLDGTIATIGNHGVGAKARLQRHTGGDGSAGIREDGKHAIAQQLYHAPLVLLKDLTQHTGQAGHQLRGFGVPQLFKQARASHNIGKDDS